MDDGTDNQIEKKNPADLAKLKQEFLTNTNESNVCSVGHCPALLMLLDNEPTSPRKGCRYYQPLFSEAGAVLSYPRKGKVIIPGLASQQPSHANTAVNGALAWVKRNLEEIKAYMGQPYIDLEELVIRLPTTSKTKTEEGRGPDVDVILHVPPYANASYLQPSMIIAIVMVVWRKKVNFYDWSVVGHLDGEGRVFGYPQVDRYYLEEMRRLDFKTIVTSPRDADQLKAVAEEVGMDLEAEGLRIIGCAHMMDMIKTAFPK